MKKYLAGGLILLAATFTLLAAEKPNLERITPVPNTETIPVMDFFRTPLVRDPQLNLAGTHIAAIITPSVDHTELMVYDLKTQSVERIGAKGDSEIYRFEWLDDRRLIYGISVKRLAGLGLFAGEVGILNRSYPLIQYVGSRLIAVPPGDRLHPLVSLHADSLNTGHYGEVVTLRTDISTGLILDLTQPFFNGKNIFDMRDNNEKHISVRHPILKSDSGFDVRYIADKQGKLAFGFTYEDGILLMHRLAENNWIRCPEDLDEIEVLDSGNNPGEVVVVGPRQEGKPRALEIQDAASGNTIDVLLQDKTYDFNGSLYRDPVSHDIVGAVHNRSRPQFVWFDAGYRQLQKTLDGFFPGMVVRLLSSDEKGKIFLVSVFSDQQPPIYNWVDLEKHTISPFKNSRPWIDPQRMQHVNVMKFKTRDGRQLDAYVTMPAGAAGQSLPPLVVLPHSEPWERISWGYDEEAQFYASRGYAVLQPNYRSSAGYSGLFPKEDLWAFRKMHDDVTAATETLLKSGLVDSRRVAIIGTSFGGYLALSGVAYEPSLYQCGVAISATYDWGKLVADYKVNKNDFPFYSRMVRKLGDTKKDPEKWEAIAPLRHADEVRAPMLIVEGEYDLSLEIGQAKDFVSVLRKNKVPAEYLSFYSEGDGVHHLDHQVELYSRIESFLAKHLGPVPATNITQVSAP